MKPLARVFDVITVIFLLMTVAVIAFVLLLIVYPHSPLNPLPQPTLVPLIIAPTDLPTFTPTNTFTPGPPTATGTATNTATATHTGTATASPTTSNTPVLGGPRATATAATTRSAAKSATPLFTQAAFQFTVKSIDYQANHTSDGCKWSSIAGTVSDLNGAPLKGVAVNVVGGGGTIDETHYSGQEVRFGVSGFEVFLGTQPRADSYTVQLIGKTGAPLSDAIAVQTHTSCKENVAIVNFQQNH